MFERTREFEAFIAPARARPQIWRMLLAGVVGFAVYLLGAMGLVTLYFMYDPTIEQAFNRALNSEGEPTTVPVTGLLLATFIPMMLGAAAMCAVHWRNPLTMFGRHPRFWTLAALGALLVVVGHALAGILQALFLPMEILPNLEFGRWSGLMLWALPLLVIQITAEELVFRGYLQQQLAARFQGFWIWMILPSFVFALGHYNSMIGTQLAWMIVFATGLFGVIAADLTRMTGSLAPAIGLHLANNFSAIFLVSLPGPLSGLSLYLTSFSLEQEQTIIPYLWLDIAVLIGIWIAARRILR